LLKLDVNGNFGTLQFVSVIAKDVLLNDINNRYTSRESNVDFLVENEFEKLTIKISETFSSISF
ncbi:MAG: hypothetical protein AAFO07_24370, partial [Bacteroidota bacterium]